MSPVLPFLLLDRYEVTGELGRGGHATVYRAHDRVLDRVVAVKLLRDDVLSADTITRFRQEVQVTAQLEHPHILHVYDTGAYEGRPYIVMEMANGRTLAERLAEEGQLPVEDALQIVRDVGLALAHAHLRGVVHRDVKPENILLGDSGAVLADFGIASVKQQSLTQRITSTGTAVGTVQYMSPEQLCAEPTVDARSDQYSLACVLYEMLAGVRPHISATFEGLRILRMTARHVPVIAHRPTVPAYVDDAITTALAAMPADRFRNMHELLSAIKVDGSGEFRVWRRAGAMQTGAPNESGPKRVFPNDVATARLSKRLFPSVGLVVGVTAIVGLSVAMNRDRVSPTVSSNEPAGSIVMQIVPTGLRDATLLVTQHESAIATVRNYLELVPKVMTEVANDSLISARYVIRIRQPTNDTLGAAFEVAETSSGRVVYRGSREAGSGSIASFWAMSALSTLRVLAIQDSAFPSAYQAVLTSSENPEVVRQLIVGWHAFGLSDDKSAERSFRLALQLDSAADLARARLAAVLAAALKFEEAYDVADPVQVGDQSGVNPLFHLVSGYRYFAARMADSALASFRRSIADHPENADGWYGLAQTLYFQGWVAGRHVGDAAGPFRELLTLEPSFARVRAQQFDASLAAGDTVEARRALAAMSQNERWRVAKQAILDVLSIPTDSVSAVVASLGDKPASIVSEVVLQLSRSLQRPDLAREFAKLLIDKNRSRDDRVRGLQFLAVLLPFDSASTYIEQLHSLVGRDAFDPWYAAACLAGSCPEAERARIARIALRVVESTSDPVLTDHTSLGSQAMDYLAQLTVVSETEVVPATLKDRARRLARAAHPSEPLLAGWWETLVAVSATDGSDRLTALGNASSRIDAPYDAFFPLRANSMQRSVLASLSDAASSEIRTERYISSFVRSWCVADVAFGRTQESG